MDRSTFNPEINNVFSQTKKHITVPVIASFNNKGEMIPIYFSVEGLRIRIDKILWHSENYVWGNQYHCQVCISEHMETIDLFFFRARNVWTLQRPT